MNESKDPRKMRSRLYHSSSGEHQPQTSPTVHPSSTEGPQGRKLWRRMDESDEGSSPRTEPRAYILKDGQGSSLMMNMGRRREFIAAGDRQDRLVLYGLKAAFHHPRSTTGIQIANA